MGLNNSDATDTVSSVAHRLLGIGGFVSANVDAGGLGPNLLDLTSPFHAYGWSILDINSPIPIEKTMYVGLGVIYALLLVTFLVAYKFIRQTVFRQQLLTIIKKYTTARYLIVYGLFLMLIIVAVSPDVRFDSKTIFSYNVSVYMKSFWGVFRASSRLIWPLYYLLITAAIFAIIRLLRRLPRLLLFVFIFIAIVQIIDVGFSPNSIQESNDIRRVQTLTHKPELDVARWLTFVEGKKHMIYVDDKLPIQDSYTLSGIATPAGLTMNTAYYARMPVISVATTKRQGRSALISGELDTSSVYITQEKSLAYLHPSSESVIEQKGFYATISRQ